MYQIAITVSREQAELISECLEGAGAFAVSLTDAREEPIYEPGVGEMPLWNRTKVLGWFETCATAQSALEIIEARFKVDSNGVSLDPVAGGDWLKGSFEPPPVLSFGEKLWVIPPGRAGEFQDRVHIIMTPGLAFGTGTHPTTSLCLEWLAREDLIEKKLLDYGCGSGILGIAALALGASEVVAVDHDEQALIATRDNAARNGVENRLHTSLPEDLSPARVDILIANVLLNPLLVLAARFSRIVNPGSRVVLSGVMKGQFRTLRNVYEPWLELDMPQVLDDWICVAGRARRDSRA